jgi:hypothetical protein
MEDKNFTIIEDIFETGSNDLSNDSIDSDTNKDFSFLRTIDSNSLRPPYPIGNIPSLSYNEDMIKNKLSRQINPRAVASQYNSMNNTNRILQPPPIQNIKQDIQKTIPTISVNNMGQPSHISCRNIYEHIENCPICTKYYKQSNRTYIMIIIFLLLIILLLMRQNN